MSMKSKDESIKLLKTRMHHQMTISSGEDIKPENIQYYASSLMMQKENIDQKADAQQDSHDKKEEAEAVEEEKEEEKEEKEMTDDADYIKKGREMPPVMKDIKVPEIIEVQHERAKNEYEKVLHAIDEEEIFGFRKPHWLNIKG